MSSASNLLPSTARLDPLPDQQTIRPYQEKPHRDRPDTAPTARCIA